MIGWTKSWIKQRKLPLCVTSPVWWINLFYEKKYKGYNINNRTSRSFCFIFLKIVNRPIPSIFLFLLSKYSFSHRLVFKTSGLLHVYSSLCVSRWPILPRKKRRVFRQKETIKSLLMARAWEDRPLKGYVVFLSVFCVLFHAEYFENTRTLWNKAELFKTIFNL